MAYLNVRVVDRKNHPISGKKVAIFISHTFMPKTWLEDYTDNEGRAYFDFDGGPVDVHVGGSCKLRGVNLNREVTVSI
jgi:hypothetical protein